MAKYITIILTTSIVLYFLWAMVAGPGDWDASAAYTDTLEAGHGLVDVVPHFAGVEAFISSESIHIVNEYGTCGAEVNECWLTDFIGVAPGAPNALLDGVVHNDTVASVVNAGDIIIGTGAGWDDLAAGANGEVLSLTAGLPDWVDVATVLDEDNVIYTSKIGNDLNPGDTPYSAKLTIQAAITQAGADGAAIHNRFAVFIYPGVYAETLTMVDYVDVIGIGTPEQVEITGVNENALITMSVTDGHLMNLTILMAPTATNATAIEVPSGVHLISEVFFCMTSNTNDIVGRFLNMDGGEVWIDRCMINYTMTGTHVNVNTHAPIDVAGASELDVRFNAISVDVEDANDNIAAYIEGGVAIGESFVYENLIHVHANNAAYTGISAAYFAYGTGLEKRWEGNHIGVISDGNGTGYCYVVSTAGANEVSSLGNEIIVEGFAANWLGWVVGAGDILGSHFDDIIAVSGLCDPGGAGTCNHVTSPADGELYINGAFQLEDGTEAAGYILTSDATGGGTWQAPGVWVQMAETTEIVEGAAYTARAGAALATLPEDVAVVVNCRSINSGVVWSALSSYTPVASMVTFYWVESAGGNLEVHICNDSQQAILCTVSYADL